MRRTSARLAGKVDRGIGAWLRASGAGGVLLLGLCLSEYEALAEPNSPRTEYFTGFEVSDNYASGYVGAGYAFDKAGYAAPGFRLRAVGAYGRYDYEGSLIIDGTSLPTTFDGQDALAATLIGYEIVSTPPPQTHIAHAVARAAGRTTSKPPAAASQWKTRFAPGTSRRGNWRSGSRGGNEEERPRRRRTQAATVAHNGRQGISRVSGDYRGDHRAPQ